MRGLVGMSVTKSRIPLKAVSSIQAHSEGLRIYEQIRLLERGKLHGDQFDDE